MMIAPFKRIPGLDTLHPRFQGVSGRVSVYNRTDNQGFACSSDTLDTFFAETYIRGEKKKRFRKRKNNDTCIKDKKGVSVSGVSVGERRCSR